MSICYGNDCAWLRNTQRFVDLLQNFHTSCVILISDEKCQVNRKGPKEAGELFVIKRRVSARGGHLADDSLAFCRACLVQVRSSSSAGNDLQIQTEIVDGYHLRLMVASVNFELIGTFESFAASSVCWSSCGRWGWLLPCVEAPTLAICIELSLQIVRDSGKTGHL